MFKNLLASFFALTFCAAIASAQNPLISALARESDPPAATTQPTIQQASVQLAVPTSQPVNITVTTADLDKETLGEVLGNTRVGQLFQGKKRVTLDDVKNPLFWIDTARDLIVALLGFIPRLIVAVLFLFVFWLVYRATR
jgi:hypothetical protein